VPFFVKASDINVSFIKPVYSKISSSPTKLGEVLSMGIPVICNSGVGDVESIINNTETGFVVNDFTSQNFKRAVDDIPCLLRKNPNDIRNSIKNIYSLSRGIELYAKCYKQTLG
jgi:hypothetical protein